MSRYPGLFSRINLKNNLNTNDDENKPKNNYPPGKNIHNKQSHKIQYPKPLDKPKTTYKIAEDSKEYDSLKWQLLQKFFNKATKTQYMFHCKQQTLFQAYSLADKTVCLVIEDKINVEYWTISCIFLAMKFEEIYPPRLKDLGVIYKNSIKYEEYNKTEFIILEKIELDMNFMNINTLLSEFIHPIDSEHRYFVFYLLELGLSQRGRLKKFTLKEIIYSIVYLLSSRKLNFHSKEKIGGLTFERIEECSKIIIMTQTFAKEKVPFLYKKYSDPKTNFASLKPIPILQAMTLIIEQKSGKEQEISRIVPLGKYTLNSKTQKIVEQQI